MKSIGIELITQERCEQIEKHGFDGVHDEQNIEQELITAAICLLTEQDYWFPENWDKQYLKKFKNKNYQERLKVAGALIVAELDRINS